MPIRMKALKAFGTQKSPEGRIKRGREFNVAHEGRARDLESNGLAYRIEQAKKSETPPQNKMEDALPNKAAERGPLVSHGGATGAAKPVQSSQAVRPSSNRQSPSSRGDD